MGEEEKGGDEFDSDDEGGGAFSSADADKSLWIFAVNSFPRRQLIPLVHHKRFEQTVMVFIFISTLALALERPQMSATERAALDLTNLVLNIAFMLEALLKIVAMGFLFYARSNWNKLDLFVALSAITDTLISLLTGASSTLRVLRTLRIFRALRPLRLISRANGLRIVLLTITHSIRPIINTLSIAIFSFAIFGILGLQLFAGALATCSDPAVFERRACVGAAADGTPARGCGAGSTLTTLGTLC